MADLNKLNKIHKAISKAIKIYGLQSLMMKWNDYKDQFNNIIKTHSIKPIIKLRRNLILTSIKTAYDILIEERKKLKIVKSNLNIIFKFKLKEYNIQQSKTFANDH